MTKHHLVAIVAFVAIGALGVARTSQASCPPPREEGRWRSDDAGTQTIAGATLRFVCQDQILGGEPYPPGPAWYLRLSGRCQPADCDWREVATQRLENGYLYATYDQGFARRFVWLRMSSLRPGELWVYIWTDFADPARVDYAVQSWLHLE